MKAFSVIKNFISRMLYPENITCAVCGNELDGSSRDGLCRDCSVPYLTSFCEHCGRALKSDGKRFCDACLYIDRENDRFDAARAPYRYAEESVHKLVWKLKYGGNPYYAKIMARKMADFAKELIASCDCLTYVPLHPKKERLRTYNQSERLAHYISEFTGKPVECLLSKTVYSEKSASGLGRKDRLELIRGSFGLVGDVRKRHIMLIDDVFTTGATAGECARVLKEGKAAAVYVLTYATSDGDKEVTFDPSDDDEIIKKFLKNEKIK